jgi:hypothetical protein
MQDLLVSMVRFSAAVTLYGLEQIQTTVNAAQGGQDFGKAMDRIGSTLDSLTNSIVERLSSSRKDAVGSVTDMTRDVISRSWDTVTTADPREMMKAATDLVQRSTETVTGWMGKGTPEPQPAEPQPAGEVFH